MLVFYFEKLRLTLLDNFVKCAVGIRLHYLAAGYREKLEKREHKPS